MRLLFIAPNRIGDAVLSTCALNYIIEKYPGIRVTVAASSLVSSLFQAVPSLERIITFDKKSWKRHWLSLWSQTVTTVWDIVIDARSSSISYLVSCKERYVWSKGKTTGHQVERFAQSFRMPTTIPPKIWLSAAAEQVATKVMGERDDTIAIAPIANWYGKQWPLANFQVLIEWFFTQTSARCVLLCGPSEAQSLQPLVAALPSERTIVISTYTDLLDVAACLQRCQVFVGNDSGLMHLSAAMGVPTIGLFGPTNEERYGPWGDHNRVVRTPESMTQIHQSADFDFKSTDKSYMKSLAVDLVYKELMEVYLQKSSNHASLAS